MKEIEQFHQIYDPMKKVYKLLYRYKAAYGAHLIEIYQEQAFNELKRIIKAEGDSQEVVYEEATRDLIRWHSYQQKRRS